MGGLSRNAMKTGRRALNNKAEPKSKKRRSDESKASKKMKRAHVFHSDPEIMSGTPVFNGTRVPIHTLVDHLASGVSPGDFLADFPTVTREQTVAFLSLLEESLLGVEATNA